MGKNTIKTFASKKAEIESLVAEAEGLLEKARELSAETDGYVYFSGPAYGMGGHVEGGEWQASSGSC